MKSSKKYTYSSKYSDEIILKGKALFEEKGKREFSIQEIIEGFDNFAELINILAEWDMKEQAKSKSETLPASEIVSPIVTTENAPIKQPSSSSHKTPAKTNAAQVPEPSLEKTYTLPISNITIKHKELFGNSSQVFLRPAELKNYGLPTATVNDLVYKASEMQDPFPFIKLGRKTLIPRVALEEWILRQAHIREK